MYVDGIELRDIEISKGSLREVVCLPAVKTIETNDWWEYDGIEPNLSAPVLAGRDVRLNLTGIGRYHNVGNLIERLSDGAYHTFSIGGRNFNYRLVSVNDFKPGSFTSFSLTLRDDSPEMRKAIQYVTPSADDKSEYFGDMDGIDLRKYGIAILNGTMDSIKKPAAVKGNLTQDSGVFDGQVYDWHTVKFKSKDIVLKCLMRADSYDDFWQQRDNLLYDLMLPGEHVLYVKGTEEELPFYYKSCSSVEFLEDPIWWMFDLTLCVIRQRPSAEVFALCDKERLLVTNDDKIIEV